MTKTKNKLDGEDEIAGRLWRPSDIAERWAFHVETVRRKIRNGEMESIIIGRRRLVPEQELLRLENDGAVHRAGQARKLESVNINN